MALLPDSAHSSIVLEGTSSHETDFIFEGGVFCAIFDGHKHPRKTAFDLYTDLTYIAPPPTINENGKRTRVTTLDASVNHQAHFYAAQLVHYGLKPLKTKAPAKKRLLDAFGGPDGKTLEVPMSILELEKAMRRRGQSNPTSMEVDRKTMSSTQTVTTTLAPTSKPPRTKQTARKTTRPTVAPTTVVAKPAAPALASAPKQAPRTKQTAIKTTRPVVAPKTMPFDLPTATYSGALASTSSRGPRTKQTARKTTGSKPPASSGFLEPRSAVMLFKKSLVVDVPQMTDAEIRSGIKGLSAVRARQILESLFESVPAVGNVLEKEMSSAKNSGASSKAKEKPVNPSTWTGPYDIEAPDIEDQYGDGNYSFEIYPSSTSKHLWASFDFGSLTGIMRSIHPVPNFLNTEIFFEWRGDLSESGMTFSDTNRAVITFLSGGLLEGKMCAPAYGTYKLYGCRPARGVKPMTRKQQLDEVSSWKSAWRNINDHNYEVASNERWGGYGGEEEEEQAFESDTTDGRGRHSSKLDLKNFMQELPSDDESFGEEEDEDEDEW